MQLLLDDNFIFVSPRHYIAHSPRRRKIISVSGNVRSFTLVLKMKFRHFSKRMLLSIIFVIFQSVTLASSTTQCTICDNCQYYRKLDSCFCGNNNYYSIYSGNYQNQLVCEKVQQDSYLNFHTGQYNLRIRFHNSSIKHLNMNLLARVHNAEVIYLNRTEIEEIQVGAFSSLTTIKELYLQENNLSSVIRGCFNSLFHLEILDLHSNQINSIEDESFHGLNSLKNLNLGDNNLNTLPRTLLSYLYNLNTFNISKNFIKIIDFQFSSPPPGPHINSNDFNISSNQITALDLSFNEINDLPAIIFNNLKNLKLLNISKNDISDLKISKFSNLQNLGTLSMHSLKLKTLDVKDFVLLTHLKELNIQSNNFKFFGDDILNFCPELKSIAIDGNQFSCSVVASMIMNSKLREIEITYTRNYQNENMDGIQCVRNTENVSELSKDISDILHNEIQAAFRDLLRNISNGMKQNGNISDTTSINNLGTKTDKLGLSDAQFSEILRLIKEYQNSSSIEKSIYDTTKTILAMKSSELNDNSKILKKMEQIEHDILQQIESANNSRNVFYEKLNYKMLQIMKNIENNTFDHIYTSQNKDFSENMKSDNKSLTNSIYEFLHAKRLGDGEGEEYMNRVLSKIDFLILLTVICLFIMFSIIIYVIGEKKVWFHVNHFKKREEICEELSSLAN